MININKYNIKNIIILIIYTFNIFIFVLIFCPSSPSFGAATNPSLKWKTTETEHFSIHFHKGEEAIVERLRIISEEAYTVLSKKFDARPKGKTEVVVIDNHDLANGFTNVIPYNRVWLRVVPPSSDSILADYDDWLRELFIHEYTHVVHITDTRFPAKALKLIFGKLVAPNGASPGWVTEGIATYFETAETTRGRGRSSFTDMLLRTDILKHQFLHLDQMAGTQYEWPGWLAQYLYGVAFWNYLSTTYGEEKIIEFSHRYGSSLWLFSLNNKAKHVFKKNGRGQSFYQLWADWKSSLEERYKKVAESLQKKGLREGESFLVPRPGESFSLPTFSRDGERLAYIASSIHHPHELRLRDLSGNEKILFKKPVQQMSFSPDGQTLLVSFVQAYKTYDQFSDLHEINLKTGLKTQITKGKRARDADFSPDGKKIIAVTQETGTTQLAVYDRASKEWTPVAQADQFDHPRWLPDGESVVVSAHREGQQDLWIISTKTGREKRITADHAIEDNPAVDPDQKSVFFTSDVTGIANIFRYDLRSGKISQVTNVLTGAFVPAVGRGTGLIFQYYTGKGYEIRKVEAFPLLDKEGKGEVLKREVLKKRISKQLPLASGEGLGSKPYNPFRRLFIPRYVLPNLALIDGTLFTSAMTGNEDPLMRHFWFADVNFRTDNQFVGYDLVYTYNRFRTPVSVGFSTLSVNYGDVFRIGSNFFEERRKGYFGISYPFARQALSLSYFFENRSDLSPTPAGSTPPPEGNYAGLMARYSFSNINKTAAAISPEAGGKFSLNYLMTNRLFGASHQLQQRVAWGDARTYWRVPKTNHQVIALRAAGGAAFGDQLVGSFGLGGSVGEGPFTGTSTRVFTLRGLPLVTFAADRVWVTSLEYRFPLFRLQRGLGTLPLALNSAHFSLFTDMGDAFGRGSPSFRPLTGVGAEVRGDFVVGYHFPVVGRLGYGMIITNRNRISGAKDNLTGADARHGVLILEVGTSF